jgi:serine/threonine protein phosphatase PrpC
MALVTRSLSTTAGDGVQVEQQTNNDNDTWTIYTANAGDARIVLGHGGDAYRLTKDHKTDDPDEVRRIEQSGGFMFKGRVLGILAVTRSLGDHW